jgi:hypothetical protein
MATEDAPHADTTTVEPGAPLDLPEHARVHSVTEREDGRLTVGYTVCPPQQTPKQDAMNARLNGIRQLANDV